MQSIFLGWLKIFGPAQNILGPVKGQGISYSKIGHTVESECQRAEKIQVSNLNLQLPNSHRTFLLLQLDVQRIQMRFQVHTMGGFQLLDLIITELKSHMTCYN